MNVSRCRVLLFEIAAVAVIIIMAAFLRLYEIRTRPGFEWDEPVYSVIAQNTVKYGYPTLEIENGRPLSPNLYHPPFDHYLKGYWFKVTGLSGVGQARVLSGLESLFTLVLTYLLVRYVTDRDTALVALLLVSSDGWLVYSNRLNLIENAMMPIGIAGLCLYAVALKKERGWCYVLAGIVLALAAIYKHTGLCFLLAPMLTWLLTRKARRHHLRLMSVAAHVILLYIAGMCTVFGDEYLFQTLVQIRRALGAPSRGLTYGPTEAIQAFTKTYWVFFTTLMFTVGGGLVFAFRLVQRIFKRQKQQGPEQFILLSWLLAAIALLAVVALKSPHYTIIVLVPLYAFLAEELTPFLKEPAVSLTATVFLLVVLGLNIITWGFLFVQQSDNALLATFDYAAQSIPSDARVLTEECIGVQLEQTYYNIQVHRDVEDLSVLDPTHLILYYSATTKPPTSAGLNSLLQRSTLLTQFSGFKEKIMVYQVARREKYEGGLVTFTFDDGNDSVFTRAFPILNKYGYPATAFIVTDDVGRPDYVNREQLRELYDNGWEIGSHTRSHSCLTDLSEEQVEYELRSLKSWLENEGFEVYSFASPYGGYDEVVLEAIKDYYGAHRTDGPAEGLNLTPLYGDERYNLKVVAVTQETAVEEVCEWVRKAKKEGAWLILTFHHINEVEALWHWGGEQLEQVVEFVHDQGCAVSTIRGGVEGEESEYILPVAEPLVITMPTITPTSTRSPTPTSTPEPTPTDTPVIIPTSVPTQVVVPIPTVTPTPGIVAFPKEERLSEPGPIYHEVVKGDSLFTLAERFYGDKEHWRIIYEANRRIIRYPNRIYPGQILVIP